MNSSNPHTQSESQSSGAADSLNIVVGIGGGIAAYKAAMLIREFKEQGHSVTAIPTENALRFIGLATLEALSGNPVSTSVFEGIPEVRHVHVGQAADVIVVAPATADLIARIAHGRADDLLTSTLLMATAPVVLAPAMHTEMWRNPATQDNVALLRSRGLTVLEPAHGRLTGADSGPGRLLDPEIIAEHALAAARGVHYPQELAGKKVVITAGGTHEAIDPVRFIGNHSSGKQGFALAEIAAQRGAEVVLIAAHTAELSTPAGAQLVRVDSALELQAAVTEHATGADVVIMAAAVADFRPVSQAESKVKKANGGLASIELVENPDILAGLVAGRGAASSPLIMGFAAETGDAQHTALEYGELKLKRKGCDLLMVNDVSDNQVFGQDHNAGWILAPDAAPINVPRAGKLHVAAAIWDALAGHLK